MKINKLTILILSMLLISSVITASERASISATATVIPMIGVMSNIEYSNSLSLHKQSASKLSIQAPKKSTLIIHLENKNGVISKLHITPTLTNINSVAELFSIELSKNETTQIVTIIPIDN